MFGIGIPEFILILIVGLIVFGPSKLPEVGRAVGKAMREFKKASRALTTAINAPDEPETTAATPAAQNPKPAPFPEYTPPTRESVAAELQAGTEKTQGGDKHG